MPRRSAAAAQPLLFDEDPYETPEHREWLARQFEGLTSELKVLTPSEWAEQNRYLPPSVTPIPGLFGFDVTPYLREILDCMDVESSIREVTFMKGVQVCATTGVLENAIGYFIAQVQTEAVMLLTADAELAKLRMEQYITPMIQLSGLEHLIKSGDERNPRKTGKTDRKLEWFGGGFLVPFGAVNAHKLRSLPMRALLRDEVDTYKATVGKDGDPMKLSESRTAAFEASRKILNISTPLFKGQSNIEARYLQGDQRKYMVRCLKCAEPQEIRWRHENPETGEVTGMVWELDSNGQLDPESVRWHCAVCAHPHTNDDKTRLLSPANGAFWKPTGVAADKNHRSYHLSALYSPVGMQTWAACVRHWLEAWDVQRNRMKSSGKLQVFYNNVLGRTYEEKGEKVRFEAVSAHKRSDYHFGQVPNAFAEKYCGSKVLLLTCTVDVQKENLAVAVIGWCLDGRAILVDYWRFEGDTEQLDDKGTWVRLRELLWKKVYVADDGAKYRIKITLVDSGYLTERVYSFCESFPGGVFPCKGKEAPATANYKPYSEFKTTNGGVGFLLVVDYYKDRWSAQLRREWDGLGLQPAGHFNAPLDVREEQLRELTVESKKPRAATSTGRDSGFAWHRIPGAPNELWDLLIYGSAALELLAANFSQSVKCQYTNWPLFYKTCAEKKLFIG